MTKLAYLVESAYDSVERSSASAPAQARALVRHLKRQTGNYCKASSMISAVIRRYKPHHRRRRQLQLSHSRLAQVYSSEGCLIWQVVRARSVASENALCRRWRQQGAQGAPQQQKVEFRRGWAIMGTPHAQFGVRDGYCETIRNEAQSVVEPAPSTASFACVCCTHQQEMAGRVLRPGGRSAGGRTWTRAVERLARPWQLHQRAHYVTLHADNDCPLYSISR